jgi:hypothetical protein
MEDRARLTSVSTLIEITMQRVFVKTAISIHTINTKGRKLMISINLKNEFFVLFSILNIIIVNIIIIFIIRGFGVLGFWGFGFRV